MFAEVTIKIIFNSLIFSITHTNTSYEYLAKLL